MSGMRARVCSGNGFHSILKAVKSAGWVGAGVVLWVGGTAVTSEGAIVGISGTMSNFDVFNETGVPVWGAELELEGLSSAEITKTYPSHFNSMVPSAYTNGTASGTKLTFTGYNFGTTGGYIIPTTGISTNGHYAVNLPGCEHFGFSVAAQPTATRFWWLDQAGSRISVAPMSIPMPTWNYVPPAAPGLAPVIQAVVHVPPPEQPEAKLPDSVWMKVFVTEIEHSVDLEDLMSGPGVVPQSETEVETEWELLEGGLDSMGEMPIGENAVMELRRYEFYKYTGAYDPEDHSPLSTWLAGTPPPPGEMGEFIAANNVAVMLDVAGATPEPGTLGVLALGWGIMLRRRRGG